MRELTAALLAASVFGAAVVAQAQEQVTLKLSANDRPDGHVFWMGKELAKAVEERTDGNLTIELYPNHTLAGGSFKTEMELNRQGVIDIVLNSTIIAGLFLDRRFDVFSLPFTVTSFDQFDKVVEGPMGDKIREWSAENGFTVLGIGINGFRQLTNSVRPVAEVGDIPGLKFRVAGTEVFLRAFELMGADAVTMNAQEMIQAMAQGVVDGQENPFVSIITFKMYEVQDYVTHWNYVVDPDFIQMNTQKFESLPEEYQLILMEEGTRVARAQRAMAKEQDQVMAEQLKELGMEIIVPTEEAMQEFRETLAPLYVEFEDELGKQNIELLFAEVEKARQELSQ